MAGMGTKHGRGRPEAGGSGAAGAVAVPAYVVPDGDGVRIALHVAPRAAKTEACGFQGAALKVRVQAPPVDGRANRAVCEFVAEALGLPRRAATLVAGEASREKTVRVVGVGPDAVIAVFGRP